MAKKKKPKKLQRKPNFTAYALVLVMLVTVVIITQALWKPSPHAIASIAPLKRVTNYYDTIRLPVPVSSIPKGALLSSTEFTEIPWPTEEATPTAFIRQIADHPGARALSLLPSGAPVPYSAITTSGNDVNALIQKIPEGMRAITVAVNEETAIEGWAQSGTFVDVIALTKKKSGMGLEAKVIAENVKILSAGRSIVATNIGETAPKAPNTVTLLCNQNDALKIKMAAKVGSITFSLRGIIDSAPTTAVTLSQERLFGKAKEHTSSAERYMGEAKGPDGDTYLLRKGDYKWVKQNTAKGASTSTAALDSKREKQ